MVITYFNRLGGAWWDRLGKLSGATKFRIFSYSGSGVGIMWRVFSGFFIF